MPLKVPTTSPDGAFPEDSWKYSPLEHVRSLFVGFFQGLFQAAPRGAYHWDPVDDLSDIYISDENTVHVETLGQRPAITCTRGPVQFYSLGLGDMAAYDPQTGTKELAVLVPGTMTVNCSSRVPLECERLAWICAEQLWLHREQLMAAGFFEVGRQPAIGAPSPAGSIISGDMADEWSVASVTCPFQFSRNSQFSPLGKHIVRDLGLSIRTRLEHVNQQLVTSGGHGGAPASPYVDPPYGVERHYPPAFAPQASDVYGAEPVAGQRAPVQRTVPHPLNPAQRVTIRSSRPNAPAVQPAGMGGRPLPLSTPRMEESPHGAPHRPRR